MQSFNLLLYIPSPILAYIYIKDVMKHG